MVDVTQETVDAFAQSKYRKKQQQGEDAIVKEQKKLEMVELVLWTVQILRDLREGEGDRVSVTKCHTEKENGVV